MFFRMHAIPIKGKSTAGIRPVFMLVDESVMKALDKLIEQRPQNWTISNYIFARKVILYRVVSLSVVLRKVLC